jgi:hypothetical protein
MENQWKTNGFGQEQSSQLADALLNAGDDGTEFLGMLIISSKLENFKLNKDQYNRIVDVLLQKKPHILFRIASYVRIPTDAKKLEQAQLEVFASRLVEECPMLLSLSILHGEVLQFGDLRLNEWQSQKLVLALLGPKLIDRLNWLFEGNKLSEFRLKDMNHDTSKAMALKLLDRDPLGIDELRRLIEKDVYSDPDHDSESFI